MIVYKNKTKKIYLSNDKLFKFYGFNLMDFNYGLFATIKIRPFINNPDLVERFKNNEGLSQDLKMDLFYTPGEVGYTDYPAKA